MNYNELAECKDLSALIIQPRLAPDPPLPPVTKSRSRIGMASKCATGNESSLSSTSDVGSIAAIIAWIGKTKFFHTEINC